MIAIPLFVGVLSLFTGRPGGSPLQGTLSLYILHAFIRVDYLLVH